MKHLGDITKINGADIEPVWCITGGSPCQDLSVAGKRAGLAGERSGLFMEQMRIVKEMRERDKQCGRTGEYVRPRYMVWENVPGAFSSSGGKDFQAVLEEIIRVAEPDLVMPEPPTDRGGRIKWEKSGYIEWDSGSLAWRTHDAQYWGVPQRRRRISLVVDFGGQSAGEILFECQSLSGDSKPGKQERKEAAGDIADGSGKHDCVAIEPGIAAREGGHYYEGVSGTLRSNAGDNQMSVACPIAFTQNSRDEVRDLGDKAGCISAEPGMHQQNYVAETVALEGNGQRESHKGDGFKQTDKMYTLNTTEVHGVAYGFCQKNGSGAGSVGFQKECGATIQSAPCSFQMGGVAYLLNDQGGASINVEDGSTSPTLRAESHQHEPNVCYALDCRNCAVNKELSATIQAKPNGGFSYNCVNPVCYGICSYASNSMKSGNPDSGIYEADTSRTLDLNGGNPACNQGRCGCVRTPLCAEHRTRLVE